SPDNFDLIRENPHLDPHFFVPPSCLPQGSTHLLFVGVVPDIHEKEFPHLRSLRISLSDHLESFDSLPHYLPSLTSLTLTACSKLISVPPLLFHRSSFPSLTYIDLTNCPVSSIRCLNEDEMNGEDK